MKLKYKILSGSLDVYDSAFYTSKLVDGMDFDPENTSNAAMTQSNNPDVVVRYLGGMGLVMPFSVLPVIPSVGDAWTVDIMNVTTNNPAEVYNFTRAIDADDKQEARNFLSASSIKALGAGVIEINCNFTSYSASTIYIFQPISINLIVS